MEWETEEEEGEGLCEDDWIWVDDIPTPLDLAEWIDLTRL